MIIKDSTIIPERFHGFIVFRIASYLIKLLDLNQAQNILYTSLSKSDIKNISVKIVSIMTVLAIRDVKIVFHKI
jgi:hypothetical protein